MRLYAFSKSLIIVKKRHRSIHIVRCPITILLMSILHHLYLPYVTKMFVVCIIKKSKPLLVVITAAAHMLTAAFALQRYALIH